MSAGIDPFDLGDAVLAEAITATHARCGRSVVVGLCGAQGSGKSSTAARLAARLHAGGRKVAVCSLDDFYLTRAERLKLAEDVHPLLATRGVPGTHDVALMERVIGTLLCAQAGASTKLPIFDKASDDRAPLCAWPSHTGRADIVILEGWCVGARAQDEHALGVPVNDLEREEDRDQRWRSFVNDRLASDYAPFFAGLDILLMLRAPSFACVHDWRTEQEAGLRRNAPGARAALSDKELARFIAHYQRLTQWVTEDEPADLVADLNHRRAPVGWRIGRRLIIED